MKFSQLKRFFANQLNRYTFQVIAWPVIATGYALISGMLFNLKSFTIGLLVTCYCLTVLGITVGYHRFLTHRSFKTGSICSFILIALGCMAYEGPPSFWVANHRKHHIASDEEGDPHSPYQNNRLSFRSFWHAHMGWMFNLPYSEWKRFVSRDLRESKVIRFFNKRYFWVAFSGLLLPALINGLYYSSWYPVWEGFIVCGLVRVCLQHHVTWSINSICHIWGRRDFVSTDNSRNNIIFGVLGLGEGWHNGHHAFPQSAKHGLLWWQLDLSYLLIKLLSILGLAQQIKVPNAIAVKDKRIKI